MMGHLPITILSGKRGVGKTGLIGKFVNAIRQSGIDLQGLISPGIYEGGKKVGIAVENLSNGERRQLAVYAPGWDSEMPERVWRFDTHSLEWGNDVLKNISDKCEILVVDEIGYLELEKEKGWSAIFEILNNKDIEQAYIVIREELLPISMSIWPHAKIINFADIKNQGKWILNEIKKVNSLLDKHKVLSQKRRLH